SHESLLSLVYYMVIVFFIAPASAANYLLSLHDALPISLRAGIAARELGEPVAWGRQIGTSVAIWWACLPLVPIMAWLVRVAPVRSEEHTSELQSRENLVCRLLLEKKKTKKTHMHACLLY